MGEAETNERRLYRRYIVQGVVELRGDSGKASGELVNIGQGGMLIRVSLALPPGSKVTVHAALLGYSHALKASGQVAGVRDGLLAVQLIEEPNGLYELLLWLARENVPWTAAYPLNTPEPAPSPPADSDKTARRMSEEELEALRAYLHQLG